MIICRDCGAAFNSKKHRRGYRDQCDRCAIEQEEPAKYLGFNDGSLNKSTFIAIYRGADEEIRQRISKQKARVG